MDGTATGDTSLSHAGITALDTNAPSGGDAIPYWIKVAQFLDAIVGLGKLEQHGKRLDQ